ncbi:hypothetical protein BD770DRAFT_161568 [Pilaira anomala]|nr:hypothetical protein BD770DRAFT_161568 [Pilaira anomala]
MSFHFFWNTCPFSSRKTQFYCKKSNVSYLLPPTFVPTNIVTFVENFFYILGPTYNR